MSDTPMSSSEGTASSAAGAAGDAGQGTEIPYAAGGTRRPDEELPDSDGSTFQPDEAADVVASLEAEVEALRDQLMRTAAEFQNYRRRTAQERASDLEYGRADVLSRFLDVFDDLRRSREAAETQSEEGDPAAALDSIRRGVALVYEKFEAELRKLGVEPIEAEGHAFDENLHDALMRQPPPEGVQAGTVLTEVQRGYRLGDRVLRHSKVVVAL